MNRTNPNSLSITDQWEEDLLKRYHYPKMAKKQAYRKHKDYNPFPNDLYSSWKN